MLETKEQKLERIRQAWQPWKEKILSEKAEKKAVAELRHVISQATGQSAKSRCKVYLVEWWKKFNGCETREAKMLLLKAAANPPWMRIPDKQRLKLRRRFKRHWTQYLVGISDECAICSGCEWKEKHHVVPLAYGGINDNMNLLAICMACHDEIHPWMKS